MRHLSREIALQIIYQIDMRPDSSIEEAISNYPFEGVESPVKEYSIELLRGIDDSFEELNDMLRENIIGWRPERMVAVDKAAITLAMYEGFLSKKVPIAIAISEAVELAKAYGTSDSGRFVNGVLGRMSRDNGDLNDNKTK
ncbi:MAG: transcription antitermination factor NusB [Synergistaceae bacterium]